MHKMPGSKVRVMANMAMAISAIVVVIVMVMGRPVAGPMLWMPMGGRGI